MAENNDVWIRNTSTGFKIKANSEMLKVTSGDILRKIKADQTNSTRA
jgi:hypothetical protein